MAEDDKWVGSDRQEWRKQRNATKKEIGTPQPANAQDTQGRKPIEGVLVNTPLIDAVDVVQRQKFRISMPMTSPSLSASGSGNALEATDHQTRNVSSEPEPESHTER